VGEKRRSYSSENWKKKNLFGTKKGAEKPVISKGNGKRKEALKSLPSGFYIL